LVAVPRQAEDEVAELLSSHLAYRVLIKPAAIDLTRAMLDVAVHRYLQRSDELVASTVGVEASRADIAVAGNEMPAPRNELLTMQEAAAQSTPLITAPQREPVARAQTYRLAWFLPIGLVVTIVAAVFIGDSPSLERWRASEQTEAGPSAPSFAEPVEADAPPADDVVGRREVAFLLDPPLAAETATDKASPDAPPEAPPDAPSEPPPTPVVPDAALASELPAAEAASAQSHAAPSAASPPPELEILLADAWSRIRENRLLAPPGDNAHEYVARATELAPEHPDVIAIRSLLGEAVAESARVALESRDIAHAESLAAEALRLGASDETLAVLDLDLGAAREAAARLHPELLRRGIARIRAGRFIAPENDNALAYLGRLRAEDPNYPGLDPAWQGLGDALAGKVEESAATADWAGAEAWLESLALVAAPARVDQVRAEVAVKRLEAEYRSTPAAEGELRLLMTVDPVYPEEAQRRGIVGWVDVELIVGTDGIPREARVVAADPSATFDHAALAAVSLYRYEPFERDGLVYERLTRLRISFDPR
jgi:protein TonB